MLKITDYTLKINLKFSIFKKSLRKNFIRDKVLEVVDSAVVGYELLK